MAFASPSIYSEKDKFVNGEGKLAILCFEQTNDNRFGKNSQKSAGCLSNVLVRKHSCYGIIN